MSVRILALEEFDAQVGRLAAILQDAVDAGAGVSFMAPLSDADARDFWTGLKPSVQSGATLVFVAEADGAITGTVLMLKPWPPNQPHRCEVAKLLVHRDFRRRGLGSRLMQALEDEARRIGRTLITFDAVAHGSVEAFYRGLGFTYVGIIPGYGYSGRNQLDDTAIFYKQL